MRWLHAESTRDTRIARFTHDPNHRVSINHGVIAVGLGGAFTILDGAVLLGYLVVVTWLGARLAGKQGTTEEFFAGGRRLPWPAVSASIIATEISAITFIGVPFVVFRPGGDLTYLQLGLLGGLLARVIVGYLLVPAYFERKIQSPYDYMGNRLGERVRRLTSVIFTLGGIFAQGSRIYLTAIVLMLLLSGPLATLEEVTGIPPLLAAIGLITAVAALWTWIGGIAAVIWTDALLFLIFVLGAVIALVTIILQLPEGFPQLLALGAEADKFRLLNWDTSPLTAFTVWTAAFASLFSQVGAYGTDQLMAQRLFCCRNAVEARKAILWSYAGIFVTVVVALVGVGLFAYYSVFPLQGEALALYEAQGDAIFPIFILTVIPTGLTGLILAGVFAAAVSSADSILAALSQTSQAVFCKGRGGVRLARALVLGWAGVLVLSALLASWLRERYASLLDLALGLASYTQGVLLAGFFLAFLHLRRDGTGFFWSAPLGILAVFATAWKEPWAFWACLLIGLCWILAWWISEGRHQSPRGLIPLLIGFTVILAVQQFLGLPPADANSRDILLPIAWPWHAPVGFFLTFALGYALSPRRGST